jgi:hypothetical protein
LIEGVSARKTMLREGTMLNAAVRSLVKGVIEITTESRYDGSHDSEEEDSSLRSKNKTIRYLETSGLCLS